MRLAVDTPITWLAQWRDPPRTVWLDATNFLEVGDNCRECRSFGETVGRSRDVEVVFLGSDIEQGFGNDRLRTNFDDRFAWHGCGLAVLG